MMHFPTAFGQAQQERNKIFESYMSSKGLDTKIGSHVEELLKKMRVFSEIVVRQVELPLNPLPDGRYMHFRFEPLPHLSWSDPAIRPLAETLRKSIMRFTTSSVSSGLLNAGITPELQKAWVEEMSDA